MIRSPATSTNFSRIFSRGSGTAYVIGENGTCFFSSNIGVTWNARPVPTVENLNAGVGPTSGTSLHALVGGNNGVIFKSTDAGLNWDTISSGTSNNIYNFGIAAGGKIFAVGANGTILASNDGGDTWGSVTSPTNESLYSVSTSGQNGNWIIACGSNGTIIKSTNTGVTWSLYATPTIETLRSAIASTNNLHFAVGDNGIILKTTDGGGDPVSVSDINDLPQEFQLLQNYPNPFNPSTKIRYAISTTAFTTLKVYSILGQEVATLINEERAPGVYEVNFDGLKLTSGTYLYKLQAGDSDPVRKKCCC